MNQATKIRAAYLRAHEDEIFSINLAGNVRALLQNSQTTNDTLYSGEPVPLIGGATAAWKAEDGYFFVWGHDFEIKDLHAGMLHSFELFKFTTNGVDVISMRSVPEEKKSAQCYEAKDNLAGQLTAREEFLVREFGDDYRNTSDCTR